MNLKNVKKALWIESGDGFLVLTENVKKKICQILGIADISVVECTLDSINQYIRDEYDYFILAVDREDLVQYIYELTGEQQGKMLVIGVCKADKNECDWTANSPCGMHRLNFSHLRVPIVQNGTIIDLEKYSIPQ